MSKRKRPQSKSQSAGSRRKLWWIGGLILLVVAAFSGYRFMYAPSTDIALEASDADVEKKAAEPSRLTGRWLRPDGGYVLQFSDIGPNGRVRAQYFNPKPINVSSAQWKKQDSRLGVFVELRDVNYPGSTYTLAYDATSDRMRGIYYQATMRQQFEVEFVRIK